MTVQQVVDELQKAISENPKIAKKPLCIFTTVALDVPEEPIELETRYHIKSIDNTLDGHGIDLNI